MERVEHDGIGEAVMNRVSVAAERIQGGVVDAVNEALRLVLQPCFVDTSGAAHNGIQQPGMQASVLSRDRSTMIVTARSTPILLSRQMCSSTPRFLTPLSRCGSLVRALASISMAFQRCASPHPNGGRVPETVVSSASVAQLAAVAYRSQTARAAQTMHLGASAKVLE
jgi:hypothetical protein